MSKIVQLHYKNLTTVLFNSYKTSSEGIQIGEFIRVCKSRQIVPDTISLPELTFILNRTTTSIMTFPEFEKILLEISEIGFKSSAPNERLTLLLKKFSKKTRTLSGAEIDVKSAYGLARQFQLSSKMKDSMSQRSILKKPILKSKMSESILRVNDKKKLNGTSVENILKNLKNNEKIINSGMPTGKHTRTSSLEIKGESTKTEVEKKLKKAAKAVWRLNKGLCKGCGDGWKKKNAEFVLKKKNELFSSAFFMRIVVRAWFLYVKGKKKSSHKVVRK